MSTENLETIMNHNNLEKYTNANGKEIKTTNGIGTEQYVEADNIADWLVEKLCSPNSRKFYCKVAYKLTRPKITELLAEAQEKSKTTPAQYFTFLANKELTKSNRLY
jgi:hypothetical protein